MAIEYPEVRAFRKASRRFVELPRTVARLTTLHIFGDVISVLLADPRDIL